MLKWHFKKLKQADILPNFKRLEKPEKLGPTGGLNIKENYQDLNVVKPESWVLEGKQNAMRTKDPISANIYNTFKD